MPNIRAQAFILGREARCLPVRLQVGEVEELISEHDEQVAGGRSRLSEDDCCFGRRPPLAS